MYYADAVRLGREVLAATGRTLDSGEHRNWTFLFRTPDPVEAGIRALVSEALTGIATVRKGQLPLDGVSYTINPDLVFRDTEIRAIGDVKYKLAGSEWDRADLYEVVAFAAGYRVDRGLVTSFASPGAPPLPALSVGKHEISHVCWPADPSVLPATAAAFFEDNVRDWYLSETSLRNWPQ
jgi:hypothetical protein